MPTSGAVLVARSEPRTRSALLLESIALRHQIAVLERSRTRRPCFRLWDRLFWILFSRWWPVASQNLIRGIHWWFRTPGDGPRWWGCPQAERSRSPEAIPEPAPR